MSIHSTSQGNVAPSVPADWPLHPNVQAILALLTKPQSLLPPKQASGFLPCVPATMMNSSLQICTSFPSTSSPLHTQPLLSLPTKLDPITFGQNLGFAANHQPAHRPPAWGFPSPLGVSIPPVGLAQSTTPQIQMVPKSFSEAMLAPSLVAHTAPPQTQAAPTEKTSVSPCTNNLSRGSGPTNFAQALLSNPAKAQSASPSGSEDEDKKSEGRKPRRKARGERRVYSCEDLQPLFKLPLCEAAAHLSMSARSLANVCRKLGIKKWPYKASHCS